MTYRDATIALLSEHAPATAAAVLDRIANGPELDAAALCDEAQQLLAHRLPVGVYTAGGYGCRVARYADGVEIAGRCPFARPGGRFAHRSCKHTAAAIAEALPAGVGLGASLADLTASLRARRDPDGGQAFPAVEQPHNCCSCGDPAPGCGCGAEPNLSTVRA